MPDSIITNKQDFTEFGYKVGPEATKTAIRDQTSLIIAGHTYASGKPSEKLSALQDKVTEATNHTITDLHELGKLQGFQFGKHELGDPALSRILNRDLRSILSTAQEQVNSSKSQLTAMNKEVSRLKSRITQTSKELGPIQKRIEGYLAKGNITKANEEYLKLQARSESIKILEARCETLTKSAEKVKVTANKISHNAMAQMKFLVRLGVATRNEARASGKAGFKENETLQGASKQLQEMRVKYLGSRKPGGTESISGEDMKNLGTITQLFSDAAKAPSIVTPAQTKTQATPTKTQTTQAKPTEARSTADLAKSAWIRANTNFKDFKSLWEGSQKLLDRDPSLDRFAFQQLTLMGYKDAEKKLNELRSKPYEKLTDKDIADLNRIDNIFLKASGMVKNLFSTAHSQKADSQLKYTGSVLEKYDSIAKNQFGTGFSEDKLKWLESLRSQHQEIYKRAMAQGGAKNLSSGDLDALNTIASAFRKAFLQVQQRLESII